MNETMQEQATRRARVINFCQNLGNFGLICGIGLSVATAIEDPTVLVSSGARKSMLVVGAVIRTVGGLFEETHPVPGATNEG